MAAVELCRKHGIRSPTFYEWDVKYGRLEVSEARKLDDARSRIVVAQGHDFL